MPSIAFTIVECAWRGEVVVAGTHGFTGCPASLIYSNRSFPAVPSVTTAPSPLGGRGACDSPPKSVAGLRGEDGRVDALEVPDVEHARVVARRARARLEVRVAERATLDARPLLALEHALDRAVAQLVDLEEEEDESRTDLATDDAIPHRRRARATRRSSVPTHNPLQVGAVCACQAKQTWSMPFARGVMPIETNRADEGIQSDSYGVYVRLLWMCCGAAGRMDRVRAARREKKEEQRRRTRSTSNVCAVIEHTIVTGAPGPWCGRRPSSSASLDTRTLPLMKESKLTKMLAPLRTSMICGASVVSMAPPPAGCWSGVNELCELMVVRLLVRVAAALATAPRSTTTEIICGPNTLTSIFLSSSSRNEVIDDGDGGTS